MQRYENEIKYIDVEATKIQFGAVSSLNSKVVVVHCEKQWVTTINSIRRNIKANGQYLCKKCSAKKIWKNDLYKSKQSEKYKYDISDVVLHIDINDTVKTFGYPRVTKSKAIYVCKCGKKCKASVASIRRTLKRKRSLSCSSCNTLKQWNNHKYIESMRLFWNNEKRSQIAKKSKELWGSEEYRVKQNLAISNPKIRKAISDNSKKIWAYSEFREKQAKIRASFLSSGKDSKLERVTQQILDQLNIPFERQKVIGPYSFDLFVPSHNLLIECQGEYWHSSSKAKQRDTAKFSYIDKYFLDHRVLYLYERDFLNPEIIKQKLIRELFDLEFNEDSIDFNFKDTEIRSLSTKNKLPNSYYSVPEEFLQSYHRAGFGRSAKLVLGSYLGDKLIAVCKFSAIKKEVAASLKLKVSEVLELDRFCIHPQYQKKHFASWFISRCVKLIDDPKVTHLVSFVDSTFGHSGINYKAANWMEIGNVKSSYHYISQDGWVIHKKTLCNHAKKMGTNESEYAEENGYQRIYEKEKVKFLLRLK